MRATLRSLWLPVLAAAMMLLASSPAIAVQPWEMLSDPVLEARAAALSKELRCVVCQNQTIDDSNAPIAGDMRVLLRERIKAGATDEEAVAFLVQRYGNFVLLKPPFQPDTWILWLAPFGILLIATAAMAAQMRRRAASTPASPASGEEDGLAEFL